MVLSQVNNSLKKETRVQIRLNEGKLEDKSGVLQLSEPSSKLINILDKESR